MLEMIQSVITRMANNSFLLKGWAVTLVSAMFVLSAKESDKWFFLIAYVPILLFWALDSYYLQTERKYRMFYKKAANAPESDIDFTMPLLESSREDKTNYFQSLFSKTEIGFYLPLALLTAIVVSVH